MGISIHYKGRIGDLGRIGELRRALRRFADQREWEILDLTGQDDSQILEIFLYPPGQCDPVSFLIDSRGWLHLPFDDEIDEPPWCSVKTQYGPLEAHVQIVGLLRQIQSDYIPNLEVVDEGSYWETQDTASLQSAREFFPETTLFEEASTYPDADAAEAPA